MGNRALWAPWVHGAMCSWAFKLSDLGLLGSWALGLMGSRALGIMDPWAHGLLCYQAPGLSGSWAHGLSGSWALWLLGSLAPGLSGSRALGLIGVRTLGLMGSRAHDATLTLLKKAETEAGEQFSTLPLPSNIPRSALCATLNSYDLVDSVNYAFL
jgi:hypothetical protein